MRSLFAAAFIGLASYGAYALLVRPETAAFLRTFSATAATDDDFAVASEESTTDAEAAEAPVEAAGGVPAPGPRGAVHSNISTETYAVHGADARAILTSLRSRGPRSAGGVYFGLTVTELEYRYYKVAEPAACRIEDVDVDLNVRITLPEWQPHPDADAELRSAWSRFSTALTGHENGHRDLAVEGAEAVREALEGMRTRSCDTADAEAQRVAERVRVETEAAHRDFDHRTGHGRTEGAVWPQP